MNNNLGRMAIDANTLTQATKAKAPMVEFFALVTCAKAASMFGFAAIAALVSKLTSISLRALSGCSFRRIV
ncbi:hypothetical protein [Hoeflea sp. BAL378]|uniref:hypothetical protein n=1 Tax=Hoeflea sp. BAL378 TaxID=1547437 RepID=UPI001269F0F4|nr:hypothetical protein [Hoeflea sp. BAL378]